MRRVQQLCIVTVLLLIILAPSAKAAAGFVSLEYPVTISGAEEATAVFGFESFGKLEVKCPTATFTASVTEASGASEALKVTPTYSKCTASEASATVTTTGCTYSLHGGEETAADEFTGKVDLNCEAGKAIVISGHGCEVKIEGQSGLSSVKYTNHTTSSPINFTANTSLSKMKYTVSKGGGECPLLTGTKENGTLSQVELATGTGEVSIGVWVDDPTKICSANEAKCAGGNTYMANTFIEATATNTLLKAGTLEITCSSAELTGKNNALMGDPVLGVPVETLGFAPCVEKGTANTCSVNTLAVPLTGLLGAEGAQGDGLMFVISPKLRVICKTKPFNCDYVKAKGSVGFEVKGGSPAIMEIKAAQPETLTLSKRMGEENCAATMTWSGTYSVAKPKALYVTN